MKCAATGLHGACEGRLTWHHVLPQRLLKREYRWGVHLDGTGRAIAASRGSGLPPHGSVEYRGIKKLLADERNGVWLCWRHHDAIEGKRFYIPRGDLPSGVEDFARDLGLVWWLENYYGSARAA